MAKRAKKSAVESIVTDVPEIVTEPIEFDSAFDGISEDGQYAIAWLEEPADPDLVDAETSQVESEKLYRHDEMPIYVVKDGDTLESIAEAVYGNPDKSKALADYNGLTEDQDILTGQILNLPK